MTDIPTPDPAADDCQERIRRRAYEISQQEDAWHNRGELAARRA
ncbi:MAG TPA: hypothetical protein VFH74_13760 [Gaiellales bacterium]|nr:hypothetical protein [Gaiellales bacterium]